MRPYYDHNGITVYNDDCAVVLATFPDACIDLTVTSPPYDNLRLYKGFTFDFETIAKQLYRVTKLGGVVVWVVGDATIDGSETGTSFKQALFFKECGFRLHDTMIYRKENPIPLNHNRYEQSFEYMFCLSKGNPRVFNGLTEKTLHPGKIEYWNNNKRDPSGKSAKKAVGELWANKEIKLRKNIFTYSLGGEDTGDHPAPFPEALVRDQILSWSNPNDVVLDPMCGSGTTLRVSRILVRKAIGIEISEHYCEFATNSLSQEAMGI